MDPLIVAIVAVILEVLFATLADYGKGNCRQLIDYKYSKGYKHYNRIITIGYVGMIAVIVIWLILSFFIYSY